MRLKIFSILAAASVLATTAFAQDAERPNGTWATINGVDSADLAILGWTLAGSTAMAAGPETGLLVTFWRAEDGKIARCIFSLVSKTGSQPFETCSLAQAVTEDDQ